MGNCACWRCRAGVGPCGGVGYLTLAEHGSTCAPGRSVRVDRNGDEVCGGVGFSPVLTPSSLVSLGLLKATIGGASKAHARGIDQLTTPVVNGPLARRLEPVKSSLMGTSGVGGWTKNYVDILKGKHGTTLQVFSAIPVLGSVVVAGLGALFVSDADKRKAQGAAYAQWQTSNATRVAVVAQVAALQHRLDYVDAYAQGLDRTLAELDRTVASMGLPPPSATASAITTAKQKRKELGDLLSVLQSTEDQLVQASADFASGGGTAADLKTASDLAAGVDAQVASVLRSVNFASQYARAATNSVNRWVDSVNAQASAAQQKQTNDALVASAASALAGGYTVDSQGNVILGQPQQSPSQVMSAPFTNVAPVGSATFLAQ